MQVDDLKGIMVRNIGEPLMSFLFFICGYTIIMQLKSVVSLHFFHESHYNTGPFGSPASSLQAVCVLFTDLVAQRGEKLELLIDKTENLVDSVRLRSSV